MSYGQKIKEVGYYHKNKQLSVKGYTIDHFRDSIWNYYDTSGTIRVTGRFRKNRMNGQWVYYYPNGNKAINAFYSENKKEGKWIFYNTESKIMATGVFADNMPIDSTWTYYDNQRAAINNDSIYDDPENPANLYYLEDEFNNSEFGFGTPTFFDGVNSIYRYLAFNLHVPHNLREDEGTSKKCYIQFTVFRNGTVGDIKVLKSFSDALDENIISCFSSMPVYIPASNYGIAVNTRFILPFKYSVGNEFLPNN